MRWRAPWTVMLAVLLCAAAAPAQTAADLLVPLGGQRNLPAQGFARHQVIDGDKIDVAVGAEGVTISGRELGRTVLFLWDAAQRPQRYVVRVINAEEADRAAADELRAALAADPALAAAGIQVDVRDGVATLRGNVDEATAQRAGEIAEKYADRVVTSWGGATTPDDGSVLVQLPGTGDVPPVGGMPPMPPDLGTVAPDVPLPVPAVRITSPGRGPGIQLGVNEARRIIVPTQLERVLIAAPDVADVVLVPPQEVVVTGKGSGTTTLIIWYRGTDAFLNEMETASLEIEVLGAPESAGEGLTTQSQIQQVLELLGIEGVETIIHYGPDGASVILAGSVATSADRVRAEQAIAALFPVNARIQNFISVRRSGALSDEELARRSEVLERMLADNLPGAAVRVRLRADETADRVRALLTGTAPTPADRLKAEQLVRFELGDEAQIVNEVETPLPPPPGELVGQGPPPRPVSELLAEAMQMAGVQHDRVALAVYDDRGLVEVSGTVRSDEDRQLLIDALQDTIDAYPTEYTLRDRGLTLRIPRVTTDVQIVEMSALDSQNLGVLWGVPDLAEEGGGAGGTGQVGTTVQSNNGTITVFGEREPGGNFLSRLDPIAASVRALIGNNRAKILSQPNVTSNDGEQGEWEVVTEVPLPSTTTVGGGAAATQSVEFRPVGIRLLVTPRVVWGEPNNQIELTLETEVSAIDFGIAINIGGATIPGITNRRAETVVTVNDNETLVIGGLTTERERRNVSRIPFLSDIPILGQLFRYTNTETEQTTVVVMMTPRILMD